MPWDWNAWPARALDEVQDMFVHSVVDSIRRLEEGDARAVQLHLGEGASRFWATRHRRSTEPEFRNSNVGEIDRLYGLRVVHDRILDRRGLLNGDFESEMRVVSEGGGSERIIMRAESHPERLHYQIEFRTRLGESRSRRFSYAHINQQLREDGRPIAPNVAADSPARAATLTDMQRQQLANRLATPRQQAPLGDNTSGESAPKRKPAVKREMSELMIAWNS